MGRVLELLNRLHTLSMMEQAAREVEERCNEIKSIQFVLSNVAVSDQMAQQVDTLCEEIKAFAVVGESSEAPSVSAERRRATLSLWR